MTQKPYYRDIWCLGTGTGYPGGSPMTFTATSRSFYASTEPIVLSLGLQRPKNNVREWERSFHFRREYARAMKENE